MHKNQFRTINSLVIPYNLYLRRYLRFVCTEWWGAPELPLMSFFFKRLPELLPDFKNIIHSNCLLKGSLYTTYLLLYFNRLR